MGNVRKNLAESRERKVILQTIFCLAWPAFLEQILQTIVQYIDTAMVGRIGAHASASVGLAMAVFAVSNATLKASAPSKSVLSQ